MDWFRMYGEFANDPKVQIMPEHMQRRLIMIFCLHSNETLETLHETELAFALRITDDELAETKVLFLDKGFINDDWTPLNWDKRQKRSDSSTERVKRFQGRSLTRYSFEELERLRDKYKNLYTQYLKKQKRLQGQSINRKIKVRFNS